uniref:Uncharacterized protein n=1 Tax=Oncorhynchus tshawytscha TaxID=74940 RepID=A0A8C8H3F0_ONCTS
MDLLPDLWKHEYWLPPGVTWRDMEQMEEYPPPCDLLFALPLALGFIALPLHPHWSLWWHSWHCSTAPLTTAPPGRPKYELLCGL